MNKTTYIVFMTKFILATFLFTSFSTFAAEIPKSKKTTAKETQKKELFQKQIQMIKWSKILIKEAKKQA